MLISELFHYCMLISELTAKCIDYAVQLVFA